MTASFTPYYKRKNKFAKLLSILLLATLFQGALAQEISIKSAEIAVNNESYLLNAEFDLELNSTLEEVINKGVPLYFLIDFQLTKPRWYWFPEKISSQMQMLRVSYHALTRQYRLSSGALYQQFATLNEALRTLSKIRNWQVVEKDVLQKNSSYRANLRMRLDTTQLPKPFQVDALTTKEWRLSSDWKRWKVDTGVIQNAASDFIEEEK